MNKLAPTIPFEFVPGADKFEENHLEYETKSSGQLVKWPITGLSLFVPTFKYYPSFSEIEKANGGLVKFHGEIGYSIGNFHEFLIQELPFHAGFRMGKVEVTFGEATPMMVFLLNGLHYEKYYGGWDSINTARILGASHDEVELALLNACVRYQLKHKTLPKTWSLSDAWMSDWQDEEGVESEETHLVIEGPILTDVHPARFFYHGILQSDDAAGCIYFYRVLEYYSFIANTKQMSALRHDTTLSESEFAKKILDLITKDEKGPLLKLINAISSQEILAQAAEFKLVKESSASVLGEEIYALRNSIVHGKFSYGYDLKSSSILSEDSNLSKWRTLLQSLAQKAMDSFGDRLM